MSIENLESSLEFCVNSISNLTKKYEKLFNQQIVTIIDLLSEIKKANIKSTTEFKNALQRIYHQITLISNYKNNLTDLSNKVEEVDKKINNLERKIDNLLHLIVENMSVKNQKDNNSSHGQINNIPINSVAMSGVPMNVSNLPINISTNNLLNNNNNLIKGNDEINDTFQNKEINDVSLNENGSVSLVGNIQNIADNSGNLIKK
jgi:hypothetical protein